MKTFRPFRALVLLGLMLSAMCLSPAFAQQQFPNKPIRLLVGYTAGGAADLMARTIAQQLGTRLGQPVVVENRTGASATIASDLVAKSPPDGYTLVFGVPGSMVIPTAMGVKLPYSPTKDFTPIGLAGVMPLVLIVPSSLPAKNLQELIALAKAQPGKLNYASNGLGTSPHLGLEMLKYYAGLEINHIPYKGQANAKADLIAGSIHMSLDGWGTSLPLVKDGKLRFIAVASPQRSAVQPQIPTIAESGFPGFDASAWGGIWGPAGMNKEVTAKLSAELVAVVQSQALRERFLELGFDPLAADAEKFDEFLRTENTRWARVVKEASIKGE